MMKEITCIICPRGCSLNIHKEQDEWVVCGNHCPRGVKYAISEMTAPTRMLTSTIRVKDGIHPVCPIISAKPIPKSEIMKCMKEIWNYEVNAPIHYGEVVISNIGNTGVDMIASRDFGKKK